MNAVANRKISKNELRAISLITYTTIIFVFIPLINWCIPLYLWLKNQDSKHVHTFAKKLVHFQVLWFVTLLISLLLISIISHLSTGQVAYGQFPIVPLVYTLFVVANIITTIRFSSNANQEYRRSKIRSYA